MPARRRGRLLRNLAVAGVRIGHPGLDRLADGAKSRRVFAARAGIAATPSGYDGSEDSPAFLNHPQQPLRMTRAPV